MIWKLKFKKLQLEVKAADFSLHKPKLAILKLFYRQSQLNNFGACISQRKTMQRDKKFIAHLQKNKSVETVPEEA